MSTYRHAHSLPSRFRLVLNAFLQRPGLPFAGVLSEAAIAKAFEEEHPSHAEDSMTASAKGPKTSVGNDDDIVYSPAIVLRSFLSQVPFKNEQRSCVAAAARLCPRTLPSFSLRTTIRRRRQGRSQVVAGHFFGAGTC